MRWLRSRGPQTALTWSVIVKPAVSGISALVLTGLVGCGGSKRPPTIPVVQPEDRAPAWSADSQWIAYVHFNPDLSDTAEPNGLYITDAAGATKRMVVPGFPRSVDWAPDSRWLVFVDTGLHIVTASGESLRTINPGGSFPSWSPDGQWIAFSALDKIWLIRPDGTDLKSLDLTGGALDPDWSPDGSRLAILYFPPGAPGEEVFTVRSDGANLIRLTNDAHEDRSPAWSPKGDRIAWNPWPRGLSGRIQPELSIMDTSGSGRFRLFMGVAAPAWDPSGRLIVFSAQASGAIRLFAMNSDGTGLRQITR